MITSQISIPGATILDKNQKKIQFGVFAYQRKAVEMAIKSPASRDESNTIKLPLKETEPHFFMTTVEGVDINSLYTFYLDGEGPFPDPRSHYQPEGVHGFSQVVDHESYAWQDDDWKGIELPKMVLYEIHVGTFSRKGTFLAIAERLDYLKDLGINAIELMPVNQTPGRWNWGYDGTGLFSVNCNYGSPEDLKFLVDNCHRKEMAVILDIVYNHFGPEGTYLREFGPYFTGKHRTPWGEALNYDDAYSHVVREMVKDSIIHWVENYHLDGFRLDAVHAIEDESSPHILQEIAATADRLSKKQGKPVWVIAETDENDVKLINPRKEGGYGIHAQWMDDFHHCVHTTLTGENRGYYADYGRFRDFEKVFKNYLYTGEYSLFWKKKRGTDGSSRPGHQFMVAVQTHDQVGNRAQGERLTSLVDFPYLKTAAGLLFFSPYLPLIFMGEEYGEKNHFLFFTDYGDPELKKAVSRGRREEFRDFDWEDVPDPQEEQTFYSSLLTPREHWDNQQRRLYHYYRDLIKLRKNHPVLRTPDRRSTMIKTNPSNRVLELTRRKGEQILTGLFNLGEKTVALPALTGEVLFSSEWQRYGGNKEEGCSIYTLKKGEALFLEEL